MNTRTATHRNGTVTLWNCLKQSRETIPAADVSAAVLATLTESERRRIRAAAARARSAWICDKCHRSYSESQGYAEVDGGYWCEASARRTRSSRRTTRL